MKPADGLAFDPDRIPKLFPGSPQTLEQLRLLESQLRERDEKLSGLLTGKAARDDDLKRLRAEIAEAKKANSARPDTHDYSEAETRDYFIDLLLKEAGWALDQPQDREFEVGGMPNEKGKGFVDYVLWGEDGKPLALVEAKRTRRDARVGQQQAKLYADCLEMRLGGRSSSTPTATSTGCGTMRATRRGRCRVSARRPNWSWLSRDAAPASGWRIRLTLYRFQPQRGGGRIQLQAGRRDGFNSK